MKKGFFLVLLLLVPWEVVALPVGNPWQASIFCNGVFWDSPCLNTLDYLCGPCVSRCDNMSFRMGYRGDFMFNKPLEVKDNQKDVDHFTWTNNACVLTLNFFDRLDVFGTMNASYFSIQANGKAFGDGAARELSLLSQTEFCWSIGSRATLLACRYGALGLEAEFFHARPDIDRVALGGGTTIYPDASLDLKVQAWQVGLGATAPLGWLMPYMALTYGEIKVDMSRSVVNIANTTLTLLSLKEKRNWGYCVGCMWLIAETFGISAEARFLSELALSVEGTVRF